MVIKLLQEPTKSVVEWRVGKFKPTLRHHDKGGPNGTILGDFREFQTVGGSLPKLGLSDVPHSTFPTANKKAHAGVRQQPYRTPQRTERADCKYVPEGPERIVLDERRSASAPDFQN